MNVGHAEYFNESKPTLIKALKDVGCVVGAACGTSHSIVLTRDGVVASFGRKVSPVSSRCFLF
jgi:alpha-tubulin suppressor-like RCC1 family protein